MLLALVLTLAHATPSPSAAPVVAPPQPTPAEVAEEERQQMLAAVKALQQPLTACARRAPPTTKTGPAEVSFDVVAGVAQAIKTDIPGDAGKCVTDAVAHAAFPHLADKKHVSLPLKLKRNARLPRTEDCTLDPDLCGRPGSPMSVLKTVKTVKSAVAACGHADSATAVIKMHWTILPNGKVTDISADDHWSGTPTAACAATLIAGLIFDWPDKPIPVIFPFELNP